MLHYFCERSELGLHFGQKFKKKLKLSVKQYYQTQTKNCKKMPKVKFK